MLRLNITVFERNSDTGNGDRRDKLRQASHEWHESEDQVNKRCPAAS